MSITYPQAQSLLKSVANQLRCYSEKKSEDVPLIWAVGRITAKEYSSPISTPTFHSSAMDGFAVVAATTQSASVSSPVILRVTNCVVAGEPLLTTTSQRDEEGFDQCVEIMTGARFPAVGDDEEDFDAVIKVEDTAVMDVKTSYGSARCIRITKPVRRNANKRFAGGDFQKHERILRLQEIVRPHHIMSLASLGIETLSVVRLPRIGVWSTGHELLPSRNTSLASSKINDANSPFIEASLREFGADVEFLGVIDDNEAAFMKSLAEILHSQRYDLLVTTGAVSKGKFDFVPAAVEQIKGTVWFHGVSMRPGHPVLFATLPSSPQEVPHSGEIANPSPTPACSPIPFFGLPGNPIAVAACLRFLTMPFLRYLLNIKDELPIRAKLQTVNRSHHTLTGSRPGGKEQLDIFRHGQLSIERSEDWLVHPSIDQSPAKMKPFSEANCWIHEVSGSNGMVSNNEVDCYLL